MIYDLINWGKLRKAILYALLLLLALAVQELLCSRITLLGVRPMFLPAVIVALGMFEGPVWGCLFGLFYGLIWDQAVNTIVLHGCLFAAVGFLAGLSSIYFINRRMFAYLCAAVCAILLCGLAEGIHVLLTGTGLLPVLVTVLLQALWSLPLAFLFYFPFRSLGRRKPEDL